MVNHRGNTMGALEESIGTGQQYAVVSIPPEFTMDMVASALASAKGKVACSRVVDVEDWVRQLTEKGTLADHIFVYHPHFVYSHGERKLEVYTNGLGTEEQADAFLAVFQKKVRSMLVDESYRPKLWLLHPISNDDCGQHYD